MNRKQESHSRHTFEDAFSDYAELSGFCISKQMRNDLTEQFYRPELMFKPLSAVQYGKNVWLLEHAIALKSLGGVYSLNTRFHKIIQLI